MYISVEAKPSRVFYLVAYAFLLTVLAACSTEPTADVPELPVLAPLVNVNAPDAIPGQYIVVFKKDSKFSTQSQSPDASISKPLAMQLSSLSLRGMKAFRNQDADTLEKELLASINGNGITTQAVTKADIDVKFVYAHVLGGFAARLSGNALAALRKNPDVEYIEADTVEQLDVLPGKESTDLSSSSYKYWPGNWGLLRIDERDLPYNNSYEFEEYVSGGRVNVYVIDSGISGKHEEFTIGTPGKPGSISRVKSAYTAIQDGRGTLDCDGHGTHVAGIIAGESYGVTSLVATLHAVRVLDCDGRGSSSQTISGINWVRQNRVKPAVANMSLGSRSSNAAKEQAVRDAIASGVTFVIAAGNDNVNACSFSPANVTQAITVGYTTKTDRRGAYSNYGSCVDIFAPGENITSVGISSTTAKATKTGTSMAAPHVAGVAALYLSYHHSASPSQVWQAINNKATLNRLSNIGTGSPNKLLYSRVK